MPTPSPPPPSARSPAGPNGQLRGRPRSRHFACSRPRYFLKAPRTPPSSQDRVQRGSVPCRAQSSTRFRRKHSLAVSGNGNRTLALFPCFPHRCLKLATLSPPLERRCWIQDTMGPLGAALGEMPRWAYNVPRGASTWLNPSRIPCKRDRLRCAISARQRTCPHVVLTCGPLPRC